MYYKNRAAIYESNQRFVIAAASFMILVSLTAFGFRLFRARRRHEGTDA